MKKRAFGIVAASAFAIAALAAPVGAAQPADPGCFGNDRAAGVHLYQDIVGANGASAWGAEASSRAGTNGALNQAWRANSLICGTYSD